MRLSRIGKKNYKNGRLMNCCAPVVELYSSSKLKYCLLFIFMDCLVVAYQSIKNPNDMIAKYCIPLKNCICTRTFQKDLTLNKKHDKECEFRKGRIASNKDLLFQLNKSIKKINNSKIDKIQKQLNQDEYELSLLLRKYPLTINFNHKLSMTFLFETELESFNWEYIINERSNYQLMDESNACINELQPLINEYMKQTLSGNNFQDKTTYIEDPIIPENLKFHEEILNDNHLYLNNHYLILKVIFKKIDNLSKDIYFNIQCDHYDNFFHKYKSPIIKQNEVCSELITVLANRTRCIRFEIFETKSKNEPEISNSFNLVELGILNKPYINFRYKYKNNGIIIVYAETYQADLFEKNCPTSFISLIDHFQPSIEHISKSENLPIPLVVQICIDKIESYGLKDIGIYRISGTAIKINQLKEKIADNQIIHVDDLFEYDLHDITGLLKSFFRDLKCRLVPTKYINDFIKWNSLDSNSRNIQSLYNCISLLPKENQNTFYLLLNHLMKISKLSNINKMTHANLSTVFGPNIFGGTDIQGCQQENLLTHVTIFKTILDTFELSNENINNSSNDIDVDNINLHNIDSTS